MKPLAIDLFCGLGGWTEGLLAEGYDVIGFDIERHEYGDAKYPAQMVIQDVLTLHGRQFKDAALIVASPPCQAYSYRAMPWKRAKALPPPDNSLFEACFRIQREAIEAAGHFIPLVVENVRGAQPWVGRSRWNFGSFHLWGDVPALMPITAKRSVMKQGITHRLDGVTNFHGHRKINEAHRSKSPAKGYGQVTEDGIKNNGGYPTHNFKVTEDGVKGFTPQGQPLGKNELGRKFGSKSKARKAASAMIAKIPLALSQHIAKTYKPESANLP